MEDTVAAKDKQEADGSLRKENPHLPVKILQFEVNPHFTTIPIAITDTFEKNSIDANGNINKTITTARFSFLHSYSCKDIPRLLRHVDHLSEISPTIRDIPVIEIPLKIRHYPTVLRIERSSIHRIESASLCHFDSEITQWRAKWRFKSAIEKALKSYFTRIPLLFIGSPLKTNSVTIDGEKDLSSDTEVKFETSDTSLDDPQGTDRKNTKWLLGDTYKTTRENNTEKYNEITLPPSLKTFKLTTLTDDTLLKIHHCHKVLKIQRLWNMGKGNTYQNLVISNEDLVPSKLFLEELRDFLDKNKPLFFRLAKAAGTKNYHQYARLESAYEHFEVQYWTKKLTQDLKENKNTLTTKSLIIDHPVQWGVGNIDVNLSKVEYDQRYRQRKNSILMSVRALFTAKKLQLDPTRFDADEIKNRLEIVAGNRADISARRIRT